MNLKKGVAGTMTAAVAVSLAAFTGVATASSDEYVPTLLGNDSYSNQVDDRNDVTVSGVDYASSISDQNADAVSEARSLSISLGEESDDSSPIVLTNDLDQDIVSLSICPSNSDTFSDLGLSADLASGESACWNYVYDYEEHSYTNEAGKTVVMPVNYTLQAELADGTQAEFHNVNMNGVRTITLCYSEEYGVNFVERTTITNHTPDPTLYYEVNLASYEGDDSEFDYHVNSAGRMGELQITESRGGGWDVGVDSLPDMDDFGILPLLYGEPSDDYTDGVYEGLYWNRDFLTWRESNDEE